MEAVKILGCSREGLSGVGGTLTIPQPFGPALYNADDALASNGAASYSYDADGNLVSNGTSTYTWNAL